MVEPSPNDCNTAATVWYFPVQRWIIVLPSDPVAIDSATRERLSKGISTTCTYF